MFVAGGLKLELVWLCEFLSNVKVVLETEFTLNDAGLFQSSLPPVGAPVDISRCPPDDTAVSIRLYTPIKVTEELVIGVVSAVFSSIDAVGAVAEVVKRIPFTLPS